MNHKNNMVECCVSKFGNSQVVQKQLSPLAWDMVDICTEQFDADPSHTLGIKVKSEGLYNVSYSILCHNETNRLVGLMACVVVNGKPINPTRSATMCRKQESPYGSLFMPPYRMKIPKDAEVALYIQQTGGKGQALTVADSVWLKIDG